LETTLLLLVNCCIYIYYYSFIIHFPSRNFPTSRLPGTPHPLHNTLHTNHPSPTKPSFSQTTLPATSRLSVFPAPLIHSTTPCTQTTLHPKTLFKQTTLPPHNLPFPKPHFPKLPAFPPSRHPSSAPQHPTHKPPFPHKTFLFPNHTSRNFPPSRHPSSAPQHPVHKPPCIQKHSSNKPPFPHTTFLFPNHPSLTQTISPLPLSKHLISTMAIIPSIPNSSTDQNESAVSSNAPT